MHYIHDGEQYILETGSSRIQCGTRIGIMYSDCRPDACVLHKHGSIEKVRAHAQKTQEKLRDSGLHTMADEIRVIETDCLPVSELNRCIDTTGYIDKLLKTQRQTPVIMNQESFCEDHPGM